MLLHRLFGGQLPKLVMFDLDGTLVDSIPDLAHAIDEMLMALGQPLAGVEKTELWVGNGVPVLVQRALADSGLESSTDSDLFKQALEQFSVAYDRSCGNYSALYPGVTEALVLLRDAGVTLAVITNKSERFTGSLLEHLQIETFFSSVVCGDTLPQRKPDPAPLQYVMDQHGVGANQSLMVGDSRHDIAAARAAGTVCVAVPYGYNHGEPVSMFNPDIIVDSLEDMLV